MVEKINNINAELSTKILTIFPQSINLGNCKTHNTQQIIALKREVINHLQMQSFLNTLMSKVELYLSSILLAV